MSIADPAYHRRWRATHKVQVAASLAKFRRNHSEILKAGARRRRRERPEQYREADRRRYARNAEKRAAEARARRDKDRAAYNALVRDRRHRNPEGHKAAAGKRRAREAAGKLLPHHIVHQMEMQGGKCFYCSVALVRYEVDHFISLANGGAHDPSNIVIACGTCNRKKNRLNGPDFLAKIGRAT